MDTRTFRDALGNFATGVTVVTTNVDGALHGMTANAVCSVSLEPMLVLVCVDRSAHCHQQIHDAGAFGLNVLAADQRPLSDTFARSLPPEMGSLRDAPFRLGASGIPLLDNSLAQIECSLHDVHRAGDHDIFVGKAENAVVLRDAEPLVFFRSGYRELDAS